MDESQIEDDAVLAEGGPLDEPSESLLIAGAVVTQAQAPVLDSEQDLDAQFGEDEDEEDLGEDDLDLDLDLDLGDELEAPPVALDHAFELAEQQPDRVAQLETAVKALAGEQAKRERKRVRRKVTAATGGAGIVGFIPILLQLIGALDVSPELASTVAAAAAALGALAAGWATPEREASLSPATILSAE
jgi:hypothetical protein